MTMREYRPRYVDQLSVTIGTRRISVAVDETERIEVFGDGVKIHTGSRSYPSRTSLTSILKGLDPSVFVQVNESMAVNLDGVTDFQLLPSGACRLTLRDGSSIEATSDLSSRLCRDGGNQA